MIEIETLPCSGCGESTWFTITEEQHARIQAGEHIQFVLPHFSPEDRELLISGTCPSCWDEMWAEEEEDWLGVDDDIFPEADDPSYESDYYVDKDCD